jgi:hypothetical protein
VNAVEPAVPLSVARSIVAVRLPDEFEYTRMRASFARSVVVISGSGVVVVVWVVPVTQPTGLPALPCVASTAPVEIRRTSK